MLQRQTFRQFFFQKKNKANTKFHRNNEQDLHLGFYSSLFEKYVCSFYDSVLREKCCKWF